MMLQFIYGIVFSIVIILVSILLSKYFSYKLIAATILVSIGFIYVGFSLKNNSASAIVLEVSAALVFYFLAILGYVKNYSLIAIGIILHGVWDIMHHDQLIVKTDVPSFWPVFCITIDIITGIFFWIALHKENKRSQRQRPVSEFNYTSI